MKNSNFTDAFEPPLSIRDSVVNTEGTYRPSHPVFLFSLVAGAPQTKYRASVALHMRMVAEVLNH